MQVELSFTISAEEESDKNLIQKKLFALLREKKIEYKNQKVEFVFVRKSVDARHGRVKIFLRYKAFINEAAPSKTEKEFSWQRPGSGKRVLVVGSGPAGLFASLKLLEKNIQPIIIERGKTAGERKRDIAAISTKGVVDADSNYCFGEGGAGTFSDGKLYTRSKKRGDISAVLRAFNYFGADQKILTDSHPHIGTNRLPQIVSAMRNKITELGGEFYFNTRVVDFIIEENGGQKTVRGVRAVNIESGEQKEFLADAVLLATGHSALDIYELLARVSPDSLEAKTFAVGVRVEHPRALIDGIQYHSGDAAKKLGAAEYRLVTQVEGRGVYSFCMCPGGFVVPSATGPKEIVVNGMSSAERNSLWSNAAIVVETRPEDADAFLQSAHFSLPSDANDARKNADASFEAERDRKICSALKGLYFRSALEHETFLHGGGSFAGGYASLGISSVKGCKNIEAAPAQCLTDFLSGRLSNDLPRSSYTPGLVSSRLDEWLLPHIAARLKTAFQDFERKMRGFITADAVLIASETRTSTPVRILRGKDSFECVGIKKLFPCGEGSGYSGGIVSSALDGENAALAISAILGS